MSKDVKVFLDDMRQPYDHTWKLFKTVKPILDILKTNTVKELSLDNDLGGPIFNSTDKDGFEGWNIVEFLEKEIIVNQNYDILPETIIIHTYNQYRAEWMIQGLKNIQKYLPDDINLTIKRRIPLSNSSKSYCKYVEFKIKN